MNRSLNGYDVHLRCGARYNVVDKPSYRPTTPVTCMRCLHHSWIGQLY